ncbi:hypothetical protein IQ235_03740 [Oscillatoriales cyanobacterium LEGE 11467]|uniref:Uncharacterized protein n=2 Tax=Zarconia TaxID=2992130 RepID=A0A928VV79_9CYAN|nr:hypothetical protein [Zarconia navalis LEGE 11467]
MKLGFQLSASNQSDRPEEKTSRNATKARSLFFPECNPFRAALRTSLIAIQSPVSVRVTFISTHMPG